MRISEVIDRLQELQKEHGDVDIYAAYSDACGDGQYTPFDIDSMYYNRTENAILIL